MAIYSLLIKLVAWQYNNTIVLQTIQAVTVKLDTSAFLRNDFIKHGQTYTEFIERKCHGKKTYEKISKISQIEEKF